ncbi:MAG TPA: 50S ribosomal protein L1 [Spirochaetota bacterium]|nr:50S ribosomal protein L1 [Spirochaetota bacterium]
MKRGKKISSARQKVDKTALLTPEDAIALMKELKFANFDESVEIAVKVVHKSYQNIRGFVTLPAGNGKDVRVLVLCTGDKQDEAKAAGADFVGADDLIEKIQGGWTDFDAVVATPDLMPKVGKLGPVLGRKGLMPKPKAGTVTTDVKGIIGELKSGKLEYRSDKTGVIHLGIGKCSFEDSKIASNIVAVYQQIMRDKPSDAKGTYVRSLCISSTMGPGIKINHKGIDK